MASWLSSCGFQPIYATSAEGVSPLNQRVAIRQITGPDEVLPAVEEALHARITPSAETAPEYELYVNVREVAQRLAIQIDATVTRYNYRLNGRYTLINLESGKSVRGAANAVTSYNIVSSQYSTLYAETSARKKAARQLAEELEREILIRFSESDRGGNINDEILDVETRIDGETELLPDSESGVIIEPLTVDE